MSTSTERARRPLAELAILVATACAAACGPGPGETVGGPAASGTVRVSLDHDPASLSLVGKTDLNGEIVASQITDRLVQYDPDLQLVPRVAESWEFSEDHHTLTFRLRPGVRWHDGTPVTADDVLFTVATARDPASESRSYGPPLDAIDSIEAVDERTVRVRYAVASPGVLDAWRIPLIPKHLAAGQDLLTGDFSRHPVGCGPYRFVEHRPGEAIVLAANDDYWDGRPSIDRLVFRIYPDNRTAYQAFRVGDLDVVKVSSAVWEDARRDEPARPTASFVYSKLSAWLVMWNQDGSNPFFTDPRVRKAMVLALDRREFADTVAAGLAEPGATSFPPESTWTDPTVEPLPYDPDRARALLDEAGWTDGDGDGVRERDGVPFRFRLLVPQSPQALSRQIVEWEQAEWAEIGVRTEIDTLEWLAFRERRNAGKFEAASFSLTFSPEPDQFYDLYHSSAAREGFNFYGLADPEIDRLLEQSRAEFDPVRRRDLYGRLQRRLGELEPLSCIFYFSAPVLYDARLEGVTPSPLGYLETIDGPWTWRWSGSGGS